MTGPAFQVWLLMPLAYLGAFASGIRPARWFGSRLLAARIGGCSRVYLGRPAALVADRTSTPLARGGGARQPSKVMDRRPDLDQGAWVRKAVAAFEGPLNLYATRLLGDSENATTWCKTRFSVFALRIATRWARTWPNGSSRSAAIGLSNVLRKEHRMTQLREEQVNRCLSPAAGPLEAAERHELGAKVLELLETLPPNQQEVLRLKFQNGFSYQEISRISGHSVSNVGVPDPCRNQDPPWLPVRRPARRGPSLNQRKENQSMTYDHDDPRLTAYALGELDASQLADVQKTLDASEEARKYVDEIRLTCAMACP